MFARKKLIRSSGDIVVPVIGTVIISIFASCCFYPFLYVVGVSFMPYSEYMANPLRIIPSHIDFSAYVQIMDYEIFRSGFMVSTIVTVAGTALSIFLLVITAYPLSKKDLKGGNFVMKMIMFTMFFSGGMIPNYLLIKSLHINNTLLALILPGSIGAFYLILMKNFITTSVPVSLEEAARIDGASDLRILFSIVVPMIVPAIATLVIFTAVLRWNNYFDAMLYITDRGKWPIMTVLRELVVDNTANAVNQAAQATSTYRSHSFTLKMAAIVLAALPILVVYPFMQRFFVKGIVLGSVKG
jgi:putative aldouronate transport system permease protein